MICEYNELGGIWAIPSMPSEIPTPSSGRASHEQSPFRSLPYGDCPYREENEGG